MKIIISVIITLLICGIIAQSKIVTKDDIQNKRVYGVDEYNQKTSLRNYANTTNILIPIDSIELNSNDVITVSKDFLYVRIGTNRYYSSIK